MRSVNFLAKNFVITSYYDGTPILWDLDNKKILHKSLKEIIGISEYNGPSGKRTFIIVAYNDMSAKLLNHKGYELIYARLEDLANVLIIRPIAGTNLIVTVSDDNVLKIWRNNNGKLSCISIKHAKKIKSVSTILENKFLVVSYCDETQFYVIFLMVNEFYLIN